MDSTKLNDWMQVIGIFAVVASLIFVGLQMKQSQEIALSAAYQARAASSIEIELTAASSPELTSAFAKLYRGAHNEVTAEERAAHLGFISAVMLRYENHHFQYESGFLPEDHWLRNIEEIKCELSLPQNRQVITSWGYRASFKKVIDEIAADAIADPSDCWDP